MTALGAGFVAPRNLRAESLLVGPVVHVVTLLMARCRSERATNTDTPTEASSDLFVGTRRFEAGQGNVTYRQMLVPYLVGASEITIVDRYITQWHQVRNLRELLDEIDRANSSRQPLTVRLVTRAAAGPKAHTQLQLLSDLQDLTARDGIRLVVEFDSAVHDRWIETSAWTIHLGKGLDIWRREPTEKGRLNPCTFRQDMRIVHETFNVTYTRAH